MFLLNDWFIPGSNQSHETTGRLPFLRNRVSSVTCLGIMNEFLITACHLRRDYQKMYKFELIGITGKGDELSNK